MRQRLILTGPSRNGTTISSKFLSNHEDIWMTNEVRLYMGVDKKNHAGSVYRNIKGNPRFGFNLPPSINIDHIKNLDSLPLDQRVLGMENVLFNNRYAFFGDKGIHSEQAKLLHDNGLNFKLIVIHRDPRDVVSSVRRHGHSFGYSSKNPKIIASECLHHFNDMVMAGEKYADDFLVIRFEDYIEKPGYNATIIENFLGISGLVEVEKRIINPKVAHMGYYKKLLPQWRNEFSSDVMNFMKEFNYV
jgi:hypothetical protein